MKKIFLTTAVMLSSFLYMAAKAQVRVSIRANIGVQPIWGPVGYDHAEYYYLPDIDVFYHIPMKQYIYLQGGRWIFSAYLPNEYSNYDLYRGYKVVVNERRPYRNAELYRSKYSSYKNHHDQETIRNSREQKYFQNKNHPEHNNWRNRNRRGRR
jgi:hypothetical protein